MTQQLHSYVYTLGKRMHMYVPGYIRMSTVALFIIATHTYKHPKQMRTTQMTSTMNRYINRGIVI